MACVSRPPGLILSRLRTPIPASALEAASASFYYGIWSSSTGLTQFQTRNIDDFRGVRFIPCPPKYRSNPKTLTFPPRFLSTSQLLLHCVPYFWSVFPTDDAGKQRKRQVGDPFLASAQASVCTCTCTIISCENVSPQFGLDLPSRPPTTTYPLGPVLVRLPLSPFHCFTPPSVLLVSPASSYQHGRRSCRPALSPFFSYHGTAHVLSATRLSQCQTFSFSWATSTLCGKRLQPRLIPILIVDALSFLSLPLSVRFSHFASLLFQCLRVALHCPQPHHP